MLELLTQYQVRHGFALNAFLDWTIFTHLNESHTICSHFKKDVFDAHCFWTLFGNLNLY